MLMEKLCGKTCAAHCNNRSNYALLVLRIAFGIIFVIHGYGKLFGNAPGMEAFTGMVAAIGFPAPVLFAYIAALAEFLGGIAALLGVWLNIFGPLIAVNMIVAFAAVKNFSLPKGDVDLALLAIAIALTLLGPGCYSLQSTWRAKMGKK